MLKVKSTKNNLEIIYSIKIKNSNKSIIKLFRILLIKNPIKIYKIFIDCYFVKKYFTNISKKFQDG